LGLIYNAIAEVEIVQISRKSMVLASIVTGFIMAVVGFMNPYSNFFFAAPPGDDLLWRSLFSAAFNFVVGTTMALVIRAVFVGVFAAATSLGRKTE
jgi:hypothetical protein